MKRFTIPMLVVLTVLTACKKNSVNPDKDGSDNLTKIAPDGFNFATTQNINLSLALKAPNGDALRGVVVSIYSPANTAEGAAIYKGVTDNNGNLVAQVTAPAGIKQIVIDPAYVGLMRYAKANINGTSVTAVIGGSALFSGDIVAEPIADQSGSSSGQTVLAAGGIAFAYPSPYTSTTDAVLNITEQPLSYGVPKYLLPANDVISASLLTFVNASLPEKPLATTHPEYLSSSAVSTLKVTAKSDVWVTFVADGAANLNTLAYYTYKTGTPPASEADITNATIVFPNSSAYGSGGGLKPGNKVKLGTFEAGTSIGFILIGNAWTGKGINTGNAKYYSDAKLNPETKAELKKHSVVLYDDVNKLTLIGFEDVNRETGSDNDFNDLVFYATSNPITGISKDNIPVIDKGGDTDGDGVLDAFDDYPNDASRAYNYYYPFKDGFTNVAFEDNWPSKGDYDMNDLVVKYRLSMQLNAKNEVVFMAVDVNALAVGASFKNGFGIKFAIPASDVKSVTGQKLISNYIKLGANGVEEGQTDLVVIPFDNTDAVLKNFDDSYFVNTKAEKNKVTPSTSTVSVTFANPVPVAYALYINPFLIRNGQRGYEVHLPNSTPSKKADLNLLGTADDKGKKDGTKYYYLSKENWPWAISFNDSFTYPAEQVKITDAYLHFAEWAGSNGTLFTDWYYNTGAGYRALPGLYLK
ncbi:LruC domain-containing protein [Mucilaginibacter calamicampi]|uniref:LruC domain-containing protein n=1 Tax=Mucilaginibacter calamicampi TaxID=1302352 RepID=A0ABW2YZ00_9SPHI